MNIVPGLLWPQTRRMMQKDFPQCLATENKRHITRYKQLKFAHFNHMLCRTFIHCPVKGWQSESSPSNSGAGALSTESGGMYVYRIQFIYCPFSNVIRTEIQEGQIVGKPL